MNSANPHEVIRKPVVKLTLALSLAWLAVASGGCVGTGGGSGNGNDNGNLNGGNTNENSDNGNSANDNSENDNSSNNNANANGNANSNDNGNDNAGDNSNSNDNGNENGGDNGNDNSDNENDNSTPVDPGLLATSQRSAFQSQCAQNVLECTTIWPEAVATLDLPRRGPDQAFGFLGGGGFTVTGTTVDGSELVPLRGDQSVLGDQATVLSYSWSHAATDTDMCTLESGPVFSTEPNPIQRMEVGFHYIRLTVTNDNIRDIFSDECGLIAPASGLYDFVEFEIEVREP